MDQNLESKCKAGQTYCLSTYFGCHTVCYSVEPRIHRIHQVCLHALDYSLRHAISWLWDSRKRVDIHLEHLLAELQMSGALLLSQGSLSQMSVRFVWYSAERVSYVRLETKDYTSILGEIHFTGLRSQPFRHRVEVLFTGLNSTRHGRVDGLR